MRRIAFFSVNSFHINVLLQLFSGAEKVIFNHFGADPEPLGGFPAGQSVDIIAYGRTAVIHAEQRKLAAQTADIVPQKHIGFDRIFAEAISAAYPQIEITFCVRGGPTLNDATREDAAAVGIPFRVIDNGNLIPGTQLNELGAEASQALDEADVILAKGMANVETMLGCGYNIYYAFLVKCQRFVNLFGKPLMTPMLVSEIR